VRHAHVGRDILQFESFRRVADEHRRFGIGQEIRQLGSGIVGIQWQIDRAGAQAREIEDQRFRALGNLDRDPVSRRDTQIDKRLREPAGQVDHLPIADGAALRRLHEGLAGLRHAAAEKGEKVVTSPDAVISPGLAKASWFFSMSFSS
jgi:hypothetical protein